MWFAFVVVVDFVTCLSYRHRNNVFRSMESDSQFGDDFITTFKIRNEEMWLEALLRFFGKHVLVLQRS